MFLNTQQTQRVLDTMKGKIPRKKISDLLGKYPEVKRHLISGSTIFVFYSTDKVIAKDLQ